MNVNIWYLVTAIIIRIRSNPSSIDKSVWQLIVAGLIGMVLFIAALAYLVFYIWARIPR